MQSESHPAGMFTVVTDIHADDPVYRCHLASLFHAAIQPVDWPPWDAPGQMATPSRAPSGKAAAWNRSVVNGIPADKCESKRRCARVRAAERIPGDVAWFRSQSARGGAARVRVRSARVRSQGCDLGNALPALAPPGPPHGDP